MARMTKRITNKINKAQQDREPKQAEKKYGKDIWLIVLIVVNFLLIASYWRELIVTPINFSI